jgi:predicted RNA-binding Zn ribbon-like protein
MADQRVSTLALGAGDSIGGNLSLDFANTNSWDPTDRSHGERLRTYTDLLNWSHSEGLISRRVQGQLLRHAGTDPGAADSALAAALDLRRHLHDIFRAFAAGSRPHRASMTTFNRFLNDLSPQLRYEARGIAWDWRVGPPDLKSVLRPVVWAAAQLMRSEDLRRVKICAGERCGWLFVDRSRRHNRRWCDMRDCGNRAKVKRHYYRHRGTNPA